VWGADRDAWVAGSLAPHGDAKPVEGGWRVTGKWMWASGSMHAQWTACGIHMNNDRGETVNFGLSLMPMSELTIEDTWFVAGMKGHRQQHDHRERRVRPRAPGSLPYPAAFAGSYRTEHTDEIVYRVALVPVTILILIGSQLGMAQAALDYVIAMASRRGVTPQRTSRSRPSPPASRFCSPKRR